MRSPLEIAREGIERFRRAEARALVGDDDARREAEVARRALRGEAREAIERAAGMGLMDAASHGALLAQLARAARIEARARRDVLRGPSVLDEVRVDGAPTTVLAIASRAPLDPDRGRRAAHLVAAGDVIGTERARRLEAHAEGREAEARILSRGPRSPDAAPAELAARAEAFLAATDDASRELSERAARAVGARGERTHAADVIAALRAPQLDALVAPRDRSRRLAGWLAPLGLDAWLTRGAALALPHDEVATRAHVAVLAPGKEVRIAPSRLELGLVSELALARGIGRALAALLVHRALPPELARAEPGSVGHALGALVSGWAMEPRFLERTLGLDASAASALSLAARALEVCRARWLAARVLARAGGLPPREAAERAKELAARALSVRDASMPIELADPSGDDDARVLAEARGALSALSLFAPLRERFNEDWYRNPRAAELLRAAAARGGALSAEAWEEELGASDAGLASRVVELAAR